MIKWLRLALGNVDLDKKAEESNDESDKKQSQTSSNHRKKQVNRSRPPTNYFLEAQRLMISLGLSMFPTRKGKINADNALDENNTENYTYRNLDVLYTY